MNGKQEIIKNKAALVFDIYGKSYTIESNEVEAKKIAISVVKEQSCNIVFAGDKILYKVTICNESCIDLYDLDFRDRLDTDIKYERNSFKYNGECKQPELFGRTLCYHINCLKAHEKAVITFEADVE